MDEVEGSVISPIFFDIVDFELDVWRDARYVRWPETAAKWEIGYVQGRLYGAKIHSLDLYHRMSTENLVQPRYIHRLEDMCLLSRKIN